MKEAPQSSSCSTEEKAVSGGARNGAVPQQPQAWGHPPALLPVQNKVDEPFRQGKDTPPHVPSKAALPRSQNQTCWAGAMCQLLPAPSFHHCPRPLNPQRKLGKLVRRGEHLTSQQQRMKQHYSLARVSTSVLSCFP